MRIVLTLIAAMAFCGGFDQAFMLTKVAKAQSSRAIIDIRPPELGDRVEILAGAKSGSVESPVLEGSSFAMLGDVIKGFAAPDGNVRRGAKEILIFRQSAPAVVLIKTKEGRGSGVILPSGRVLTNRHVVEGIGAVQLFFKPVELSNSRQTGEVRTGKVQFVDPKRDLAIIVPELLPSNYKSLRVAPRDDLDVGADVYAIGHPLGYTWTFTQGIVSGMRRIENEKQDYTAI